MQLQFLLLMICALAAAQPRNNRSVDVESETKKTEVQELPSTTTTVDLESETEDTEIQEPPGTTTTVALESETEETEIQEPPGTTTTVGLESEIEETEIQEPPGTTTTVDLESETEDSETQEPSTTTTETPESKVIIIESSGDFETRLTQAGGKLVVVFAMTTWCPQSRRAEPNVEAIAANTDLVVLKVDVDNVTNTPGISWKYGVTGIGAVPTFFFVRNGVLLEHYAGSGPKKMRRVLAKYLAGFKSDSHENA